MPPPSMSASPTDRLFCNMTLYGILISQVWAVFVVETANTAFDISTMNRLDVHAGEVPDKLPTVFVTQPFCVILVGFPIQLFFIWRIHAMTKNKPIAFGILCCALVALGGGVWTTVLVPIVATFPRIPLLYRSAEVWLISSTVTDICIYCVGFGLHPKYEKNRLGRNGHSGEQAHSEALFSILDVVCFLTLRGETVNFFFNIALSKIYASTLVSTLNARKSLKRAFDAQPAISWAGVQVFQETTTVTDGPGKVKGNAVRANEAES
ncbi:hypothetical protein C8R45DRAFT_1215161, partial [Mycena sanguinolenta]